jgi:hypothetical protein
MRGAKPICLCGKCLTCRKRATKYARIAKQKKRAIGFQTYEEAFADYVNGFAREKILQWPPIGVSIRMLDETCPHLVGAEILD